MRRIRTVDVAGLLIVGIVLSAWIYSRFIESPSSSRVSSYQGTVDLTIADNYIRSAELLRVVDGDTVDLRIDLGWDIQVTQRIRLAHVDTPEVRGAEREFGLIASDYVKDSLSGDDKIIFLKSVEYKRDKYGRAVGVIYVNGQSINQMLLDNKMAWATDDKGALLTPRDLELLTGLQ